VVRCIEIPPVGRQGPCQDPYRFPGIRSLDTGNWFPSNIGHLARKRRNPAARRGPQLCNPTRGHFFTISDTEQKDEILAEQIMSGTEQGFGKKAPLNRYIFFVVNMVNMVK
jgi:hypothetical protein